MPDQPATLDANMNSSTAGSSWAWLQNREHFPLTVLAAMRGGVSQRTLANILSSFAVDMGLATKEDPHLLVDQAKVSGEQEREMTRLIARADNWMTSSTGFWWTPFNICHKVKVMYLCCEAKLGINID